MDKRTLLAIALSLLILVGYQEMLSYFYPPPPKNIKQEQIDKQKTLLDKQNVDKQNAPLESQPPAPAVAHSAKEEEVLQPTAKEEAREPEAAAASVRDLKIENDVYSAVLTSLGGRLKSVQLKHYPGDAGKGSPPREMVREGGNGELPLAFQLEGKGVKVSDENVRYEVKGGDIRIEGEAQKTIELTGKLPNGSPITKTFGFSGDTYGMELTVSVKNAPAAANFVSLVWTQGHESRHDSSYYHPGPVALIDRKFTYEYASKLTSEAKDLGPARIRWGGYADTYFLDA